MAAREPVTPDQLRVLLQRKFLISAAGIVADPARAAEAAMEVVTPVLEGRDTRIAELEARAAALEVLAEELIGEYRPYPSGDSAWYGAPAVVSGEQVARWRAVLDGTPRAS